MLIMIKKSFRLLAITSLFSLLSISAFSDAPPPPPDGGPGGGDKPVGGGSPIGGGLIILATLGAAYSAKKIYFLRQEA